MRGRQRRERVDPVDIWCTQWARQRRIALGIIQGKMIEPKERLGQLRCTLAKVRSERDGASYSAKVSQQFPEVYEGDAVLVHRGYMTMQNIQRAVMHLHYVWREIDVRDKAGYIPITIASYWTTVTLVKAYIHGYMSSHLPVDEFTEN